MNIYDIPVTASTNIDQSLVMILTDPSAKGCYYILQIVETLDVSEQFAGTLALVNAGSNMNTLVKSFVEARTLSQTDIMIECLAGMFRTLWLKTNIADFLQENDIEL